MILIFEENENSFNSLGLGSLRDVTSCEVSESLNDTFDLTMEYPIDGLNFSKLKENRIIYCKPNPYDEPQAFRIKSITKPLKGIVTVNAVHISYDMNGFPVRPINGNNIVDSFEQLSKNSIVKHNFKFQNKFQSAKTFKTVSPYNMRSILMGGDESLLTVYDCEVKFNNFMVELYQKRGKNRGAKVSYGHNMTDLKHESNIDNLYNGLYPYYSKEETTTETTGTSEFTKAYIVGTKPLTSGWLSFEKDGEPYMPLNEAPIQIMTEGPYYQKVFTWSNTNQKYIERIYNEQVIIIQGLTEPSWLRIDWSGFPKISVRAAKKGYYKKMTETDWGEIKGVGDIIFEGSLLNLGSISDNLVIYYSEVIPTSGESANTQETSTVLIELDDPIIKIDTKDTKMMKHDNILSVNLASEFDEEPTKDQLKQKAEEYIRVNKIGYVKHTTTVSFVDLAKTTEKNKYQNFDHIELGDTVQVIYEDLGVNTELRVIDYTYNVLTDSYESVNLGEKEESLSAESIQTGDNVSSLSNDADYSSRSEVEKLIAKVVTAEYIEATNAKMSKAQINQLSVERIAVSGVLEASQWMVDEIVANMLTAKNAKISGVLESGSIKVKGNIEAITGLIGGFTIDSNSLTTGTIGKKDSVILCTGSDSYASIAGSENINNWVFTAGLHFGVTKEGTLYASNAKITGEITAKSGSIGGFEIDSKSIHTIGYTWGTPLNQGIYLSSDPNEGFKIGKKFTVTNDGEISGTDASFDTVAIRNGSIKIGERTDTLQHADGSEPEYEFEVDNAGNLKSNSAKIGRCKIDKTSGGTIEIGETYLTGDVIVSNGEKYNPDILSVIYMLDANGNVVEPIPLEGWIITNVNVTKQTYIPPLPSRYSLSVAVDYNSSYLKDTDTIENLIDENIIVYKIDDEESKFSIPIKINGMDIYLVVNFSFLDDERLSRDIIPSIAEEEINKKEEVHLLEDTFDATGQWCFRIGNDFGVDRKGNLVTKSIKTEDFDVINPISQDKISVNVYDIKLRSVNVAPPSLPGMHWEMEGTIELPNVDIYVFVAYPNT